MSKCQIVAVPTHIKYANKNGFVVLVAKDLEGQEITLTGSYDAADMLSERGFLNHRFCFFGEPKHTSYGEQFAFSAFSMIYQDEKEEMFYFLTRMVSGISEKNAKELIAHFGDKLTHIIEHQPELLKEVKGIKQKKATNIQKSWKDKKHLLNLTGFLAPYGISNTIIRKIFDSFGEKAQEKILENPYILTSIRGFGFKRADEIALKLGFDETSIHRLKAALLYYLKEKMQGFGDTFEEKVQVFHSIVDMLEYKYHDLPHKLEEAALELEQEEKIVIRSFKDTPCIFLKSTHDKEAYIYETLRLFRNRTSEICTLQEANQFIDDFEKQHNLHFSLEQKEAILMAQNGNKIISITGAAGTGKTSVSKAILGLLEKRYDRENIRCCALSGVAAARVRKQSGYQSSTIHSLLEYSPISKRFERNEQNPLEANVILLDEASMVEVNIFYSLLKAIDFTRTHLILLGDAAQLLPVGCGEIFNDILEYNLTSIIRLTKIFRQSENSALTTLADEVRMGRVPDYQENKFQDFFYAKIDIPYFWRLRKISTDEEYRAKRDEIQLNILHYAKRIFERINEVTPERFSSIEWDNMERLWDRLSFFQILSPQKDGILGVKNLNKEAQSIFNPQYIEGHFFTAQEYDFKLGDKVIHLVNKNMSVLVDGKEEEVRVYNGQIGVISKIDLEEDEISVTYPNEGYVAVYAEQDFKNAEITLAYAISIHKSQGSEFTKTFIPFSMNHMNMLNSKLIYTALTRAKEQAICAGESYAFEMGCKRKSALKRKTLLKFLAQEERESHKT